MIIPRIARKNSDASFFHVMVQGINGEYIFEDDEFIMEYLELLGKYKKVNEIDIVAYCIMTNHAHLLLYVEEILQMSRFMQKVNTIYAQKYNEKKNRYGYVFRDRFLAEPINNDRYLAKCINYIHLNPVKAGIVEKCEDYPYSSYRDYISQEGVKSPALEKVLGKIDFSISPDKIKNLDLFADVDIDKKELISHRIQEFTEEHKKSLQEILKDKTYAKGLIRYLKAGYRIKYKDISEVLKISSTTINRIIR